MGDTLHVLWPTLTCPWGRASHTLHVPRVMLYMSHGPFGCAHGRHTKSPMDHSNVLHMSHGLFQCAQGPHCTCPMDHLDVPMGHTVDVSWAIGMCPWVMFYVSHGLLQNTIGAKQVTLYNDHGPIGCAHGQQCRVEHATM